MTTTGHPTRDVLRDYLDGKVSRSQAEQLSAHIAECQDCVLVLAEVDVETPLVGALRASRMPAQSLGNETRLAEIDIATRSMNLNEGTLDSPVGLDTKSFDGATKSFGDDEQAKPAKASKPSSAVYVGSSSSVVQTSIDSQNRLNDYEILGELGHGGMGVVYKAKQKKLNRLVALKMVLAGARAKPSVLTRFRSEAQAVAKLDHPNIVQIYDIGEHDDLPFFSMEFVDGGSLEGRMDHKPLEPMFAARLMLSIARGMDYAHKKGVIHRDLKPANILLTHDNTPKVTDFGLARMLDDTDAESGATKSGAIMGTPSYMAPEQADGRTKYADHLADVYSLGATLYAMLTGRPPFSGPSVASILSQVRESDPVSPNLLQPTLPKDLQTIALKCLQKNPEKRYASAGELANDLDRHIDGRTILARPVSSAEKLLRWCQRKKGQAAATFTAVGLAIGFLVSLILFNVQLTSKNHEISKQNAALEEANTKVIQELTASQKTGDATYQTMRRLRQSIIPEFARLGLVRQKNELMKILQQGMQDIERASPEGVAGLERNRILYLMDLADQHSSPTSLLPGTIEQRLTKAEAWLTEAHTLGERITAKPDAGDLAFANYALVLQKRGELRYRQGKSDEAKADFAEAIRLNTQIAESPRSGADSRDYIYPANAWRSVAQSHSVPGILWLDVVDERATVAEHLAKADEAAQKALQLIRENAAATYDGDGQKRFEEVAALARCGLAALHFEQALQKKTNPETNVSTLTLEPKLAAQSIRELGEAVAFSPDILKTSDAFGSLTYPRTLISKLLFKEGYEQFKADRIAEANAIWGYAHDIVQYELATADEQTRFKLEADAARLLYGLGSAELRLKQKPKALERFAECVLIRQRLFVADPNPNTALTLLVAQARAGKATEALKLLEREREGWEKPERAATADQYWFQVVCTYSLCAEMLGGLNDDGTPKADVDLAPELLKARTEYLKQASAAAERLRTMKSTQVPELATDPDCAFWRTRSQ